MGTVERGNEAQWNSRTVTQLNRCTVEQRHSGNLNRGAEAQLNSRTVAQWNRGTLAQRNSRTVEERHTGTEEQ